MADGGDGDERRGWCGSYILDANRNPVPEYDIRAWGEWMDVLSNRTVRQSPMGSWRVSTVFLGLDHGFGRSDSPVLFETMVFKAEMRSRRRDARGLFKRRFDENLLQCRYCTWTGALRGHMTVLRLVHQVRAHVRKQQEIVEFSQ